MSELGRMVDMIDLENLIDLLRNCKVTDIASKSPTRQHSFRSCLQME